MSKKTLFILIGIAGILFMCLILIIAGVVLVGTNTSKTCNYNGQTYKEGESFKSADGCNTCGCSDGKVACTLMACATETPNPIPSTTGNSKECKSVLIGISFDVPDNWKCTVDEVTPQLTLSSDNFYAEFTPYGRGYCEGSGECKITDLYKSQYMHLFIAEQDGNSESLGVVNKPNDMWVTAVYNVKYDKTADNEIKKVLDTLKFEN